MSDFVGGSVGVLWSCVELLLNFLWDFGKMFEGPLLCVYIVFVEC